MGVKKMEIKLTWSHFLTQYLVENHDGEWERHYDTFESIEWRNGATPPLETDVEAGVKVIQDEYDAQEYARNRQAEYPDWGSQLNKIYDDGLTKWKSEMVDPIKAKYPKP
jgi:hypothetical protein